METNKLPKEELNLIAQIDARLKRLEDIYFSKGEELKQPIEQVEQPKEEAKERWQPSYGCKYWYIGINDGQFFISDFHWGNDDVDFINHGTGNCFPTEEAAQSAAEKIKALLATI